MVFNLEGVISLTLNYFVKIFQSNFILFCAVCLLIEMNKQINHHKDEDRIIKKKMSNNEKLKKVTLQQPSMEIESLFLLT